MNQGEYMNMFKIEKRDLEMNANHMRKGGTVPGAIYGKHIESCAVKATALELSRVTDKSGEIYKVSFDGKNYFTKLEEVQRHPVTGDFVHFSLLELPKGENSTLDIPLRTENEAKGEKDGGTIVTLMDTIPLSGLIKDMPEELIADVSKLEIGDKLTIEDLNLSKKLTVDMDSDEAIIVCKPPSTVEEPDTELDNKPEDELEPPMVDEESESN
jgi:large subunit ribosomal protein L25